MAKLKLAVYWTAACGGCDMAMLDMGERVLELDRVADIVLWPLVADFKYSDVRQMEDNAIDVCLLHGAVRNEENRQMAELLRQKSRVLVALGSCACFGGIPGLANFFDRQEIFTWVYLESQSTDNAYGVCPQTSARVPEGELTLPEFFDTVLTLDQVVDVDYYIPGCPPTTEMLWQAVQTLTGDQLPPKGTVFAGSKTLCDRCTRQKEGKSITEFRRLAAVDIDPQRCFLEQGIVCCGPATRNGCGGRCLRANMPCRGCFGPTEHVRDQGARLVGAIAAMIASDHREEIEKISHLLPVPDDPAATFYRFSLPHSLLKRKRKENAS